MPQLRLISSVTNAEEAVVTTTEDHGYETGMFVRIFVPHTYGMEIYEQTEIEVLSDTTFRTQINTSNVNPFVAPSLYPPIAFTPAQAIPMTGTEDNVA